MSFSYQPVPQRIQDCIRQFDYHALQGNCPTNWRSTVDLKTVRFGSDSLTDNFPAKVFGSWERAKSVGRFGWACILKDLGCIASKDAGTLQLRQEWEKALKTDKVWECNSGVIQKFIRGCLVSIYQEDGRYAVHLTRNENAGKLGSVYKSVSSAKRAVRKMINQI